MTHNFGCIHIDRAIQRGNYLDILILTEIISNENYNSFDSSFDESNLYEKKKLIQSKLLLIIIIIDNFPSKKKRTPKLLENCFQFLNSRKYINFIVYMHALRFQSVHKNEKEKKCEKDQRKHSFWCVSNLFLIPHAE